MHILHTVLYTFPMVLKRRICLTITSFNLELVIPSFILVRDSEVILTPNTLVLEIRFRVTKRPSKVIQFFFFGSLTFTQTLRVVMPLWYLAQASDICLANIN